ncbi:unnamed protein product (macronuclear) [Paramecium tetraurelia]|uniref:Vta1/callose synthase N-terminal domain-containing protein n=1 Tax=Paramecium tetraurelia TaxID=5888 RepID=A0BRR4_PARTE|nr:uncharacterized protein GSPATT00031462001 [Paramecium tetraurelia]CAK61231.1 unnamed protein product [Paramecium tetraurelia]|eukprot:XP_001428629.1 hypothetical protein (macronuclear) [Paramecium tetraurelia strain d4-2]
MQQNPEFKQIQGLLQHSQQLSTFNITFAYITKAYVAQRLHALYKKTQQQNYMQMLQQLISELESLKTQNPQLQNKEENKKHYTEFVYKFFYDADTRERDGEVSQELMHMFGSVQKAIEVLQYFEPLNQDQLEKQKYAKFKMVDQHKKLKDPTLIQPKPKDSIEEELEQIAQKQLQISQHQQQNTTQQQLQQQQTEQPAIIQQPIKPGVPQNETPQTSLQQQQSQYQQQLQQQQQQWQSQQKQQQSQYQQQQQQQQQLQQQQQQQQQQLQQQQQQQLLLQQQQYQQQQQQLQQQQQQLLQQQQQQQLINQQQMSSQAQPQSQQGKTQATKLSPMEQAQMRNQIKTILQQAISEVDFKKYQNAKDQLQKTLGMLQQLLDSQ